MMKQHQPIYFVPVPEILIHNGEDEACPCKPSWHYIECGDHVRQVLLHKSRTGIPNMPMADLEQLIAKIDQDESK